jgi:lysophospholipase L1-like esterase
LPSSIASRRSTRVRSTLDDRLMINRCLPIVAVVVFLGATTPFSASHSDAGPAGEHWIGTWATAEQPARPADAQTFRNRTLRLIVRTSAGGKRLRIKVSNVFGDQPLAIGSAHIARRADAADIEASSDRMLTFRGAPSTTIPPRSAAISDPIDLDAPPLSDLAISLFFPQTAVATTSHSLALQTSYVAPESADASAEARFPVERTIASWPFLAGVDVAAPPRGAAIVAFGSSTTDGDGSTRDANRRWPDVLAERLQKSTGGAAQRGVLNEGIIGNRLLYDSPRQANNPFGPMLGEVGLVRFERDVLDQPGAKYVLLCLGVNDILFPAFPFTPPGERVTAEEIVAGYRQLIARARRKGVRVIGTTIPPFEGATFSAAGLNLTFYTPERESARQAVNEWVRRSRAFDAVVDFDEVLRDPTHPARLLPAYAAADHLHVNDAGNVAQGYAIPLSVFRR